MDLSREKTQSRDRVWAISKGERPWEKHRLEFYLGMAVERRRKVSELGSVDGHILSEATRTADPPFLHTSSPGASSAVRPRPRLWRSTSSSRGRSYCLPSLLQFSVFGRPYHHPPGLFLGTRSEPRSIRDWSARLSETEVEVSVSKWGLFCDPTDCSPPGSSVHRILQARTLEWVAMPVSRAACLKGTAIGGASSRIFLAHGMPGFF